MLRRRRIISASLAHFPLVVGSDLTASRIVGSARTQVQSFGAAGGTLPCAGVIGLSGATRSFRALAAAFARRPAHMSHMLERFSAPGAIAAGPGAACAPCTARPVLTTAPRPAAACRPLLSPPAAGSPYATHSAAGSFGGTWQSAQRGAACGCSRALGTEQSPVSAAAARRGLFTGAVAVAPRMPPHAAGAVARSFASAPQRPLLSPAAAAAAGQPSASDSADDLPSSSSSSSSRPPQPRRRPSRADGDAPGGAGPAVAAEDSPALRDLSAGGAQLLSDEALQQIGVRLPSHCCGCGIRLQRRDAAAPGFFIVPVKLLEAAAVPGLVAGRTGRQAGAAAGASSDDDGSARTDGSGAGAGAAGTPDERARLEMDAGAQADRLSGFGGGSDNAPDVLCQRCYGLKHSGTIKVQEAEGALPEFDLGKKVGRKIFLQRDRKAVVLCVVDVWDFDGSLPRLALRSLFPPGTSDAAPEDLKFKLMIAVNKFDLLPKDATPLRVQQWVRTRLKQAGLPSPEKVFMVSAVKGMGIEPMVQDIREALGFRGDLWVVGAQNAGKSSLITAMKRLAGTAGKGDPTIAPVPGTTLGLLQVPGVPLGPKHRAFDTPGVPHAYQLTARLPLEDVKKVLPSKQLRGRTYRVSSGNTLLIGGGLARLDVLEAPGPTLYLTVFVSHFVNLHMGKTEDVEGRLERIGGTLLTPPDSRERCAELPAMAPVDVRVDGSNWKASTVDIAVAGLGWVAVGCQGPASFRVWTLPGVAVTTHGSLIPDYAQDFERPGISTLLPKAQQSKAKDVAKDAVAPGKAGTAKPAAPRRGRAAAT